MNGVSHLFSTFVSRVVEQGAVVPPLCRLEVANAFQSGIKRKRIDAAYRDAPLADLERLPIAIYADTATPMPGRLPCGYPTAMRYTLWNWRSGTICLWQRSTKNYAGSHPRLPCRFSEREK